MKKEVVSVYVDNKANVLTRVVSLYGRRGFNIDSLTVSATNDPAISRITIVFEGDNLTLHQIVSQTEKLEIVRSIKALRDSESFFRGAADGQGARGQKCAQGDQGNRRHYRAKIINLTQSEMVLELTGSPEKLDAFLGMLSTYEILDICRTGVTGIEK